MNGSAEVAALEPGFEHQGGVVLGGRQVKGKCIDLIVFGVEITGGGWLLLVVDDLVQKRIHKDYYLDVLFYRFL